MDNTDIVLHGYYRSSSSWRLRTIMNLKEIPYTQKPVNLVTAEHSKEPFKALNPAGLVPALSIGDLILIESMSIAEFLEEKFPST